MTGEALDWQALVNVKVWDVVAILQSESEYVVIVNVSQLSIFLLLLVNISIISVSVRET
jgi:hypothetical protein